MRGRGFEMKYSAEGKEDDIGNEVILVNVRDLRFLLMKT